jgi:hypothetical protein
MTIGLGVPVGITLISDVTPCLKSHLLLASVGVITWFAEL